MKRPLLLLALSTLLGSSEALAPNPVLLARQSAVQILMAVKGKQRAMCSGAVVMLKEGPRILTAGHCSQKTSAADKTFDHASFSLLDADGHVWPMRLERAEFHWPTADYSVFASPAQYFLPALKVDRAPLQISEDVYSWSGPAGMNIMLFHGETTGVLHFPTDPTSEAAVGGMTYAANLLTAPGASGSMVLNERGEATSILVGGFDPKVKLAGSFFAPIPE